MAWNAQCRAIMKFQRGGRMNQPGVCMNQPATSLRPVQAPGMSSAEWDARVNLAAAFRVAAHLGWNFGNRNHIALRLPDAPNHILMNAQNFGWHEMTASCLLRIDL